MVLTAKNAVFYNVTLCSVVKVYRRFREAFCCHHQGRWISYSGHTHLPWWKRLQDPWTICHSIRGDISLHNVDYNKVTVCLSSVCRRTDTNLFRHSNGTAKRYILHSLKDIYSPLWQRYNKLQTLVSSWKISVTQPKNSPQATYNVINMSYEPVLETKLAFLFSIN